MLTLLNLFRKYAEDEGIADAFVVGGTVRDLLLGRQIKDADIVLKRDAEKTGRAFADATGASFVLLDRDFGIVRVARDNAFIDICTMYGGSILDDLANRDLTINAMAIPLSKMDYNAASGCILSDIIDPFNGQNDLRYKIIRMISEANLVKDPLRLLRVYRFAAVLNYTVEVNTASAVRTHAFLISDSAVERIAEELRHIVLTPSSYSTLKDMEKDGLLLNLFPELSEIGPDLWRQAKQAYGYAEHIMHNLSLYFPGRSKLIQEFFSRDLRIFCLKLAVLTQDGIIADKVAARLKLSRREGDFIRMLEANHSVIAALAQNLKPAVMGILREFGDDVYALLVYILASERVCQLSGSSSIAFSREIVSIYQDEFLPRLKKLPFISGHDLISEFGLSPSPFFKDILTAIELLALEGLIGSRSEALAEAGKLIHEKGIAG